MPAMYPDLWESIRSLIESEKIGASIVDAQPGEFSDKTPQFQINTSFSKRKTIAVIPGFISGPLAQQSLNSIIVTGHTLRMADPDDERTPACEQLRLVLTDCEGRGAKTTLDKNGQRINTPELKYAYFIGDQLAHIAKATHVDIIDPHDHVLPRYLEQQGVIVNTYSALGLIAARFKQFIEETGIPRELLGILLPDTGAIGRSLYFSMLTDIPVIGKIDKVRENGDVRIAKVHGAANFPGRVLLMIDDMIAKGRTLVTDGSVAKELGALMTVGIVTHTKGVKEAGEVLSAGLNGHGNAVDHIFLTNSTPYYRELQGIENLHLVDMLPLIGMCMQNALREGSVPKLDAYCMPVRTPDENLEALKARYPGLLEC